MRKILIRSLFLLSMLVVISCNKGEFKVKGIVSEGGGESISIEKPDFQGRWVVMDSVKLDKAGKFNINLTVPTAPEIYRLRLDDNYIYLPVTGEETLTVETSKKGFGKEFRLAGSEQARLFAEFDKKLHQIEINDDEALSKFEREVFTNYLKDAQGSILSYYILTKTIDGKPLYDLDNREDMKYYAAVATAFEQYKPEDPHTSLLRDMSIRAMQRRNSEEGKHQVIEAEETGIIDIELPDENGKNVKLSETVGKGKPTLLVISLMNEAESPAINKSISDFYNSHGKNMEIYHVSVDEDQYAWREAAMNLPWTTVYDRSGSMSNILLKYNVESLPVYFIYDSAGNLNGRSDNVEEIKL